MPHVDIRIVIGEQDGVVAHPFNNEGIRAGCLIDDMFFRADPGAFEGRERNGENGAEAGSLAGARMDHLHLIRIAEAGCQGDERGAIVAIARLDLVDVGKAGGRLEAGVVVCIAAKDAVDKFIGVARAVGGKKGAVLRTNVFTEISEKFAAATKVSSTCPKACIAVLRRAKAAISPIADPGRTMVSS